MSIAYAVDKDETKLGGKRITVGENSEGDYINQTKHVQIRTQ